MTTAVESPSAFLMTSQRSLATSAFECARLLNNLSTQLIDKEWEARTALSQPSIEDESVRYKIWAGNLGAFQRLPATSSLDYRVRESPKVATQIQELLEDLRHALEKVLAIACGAIPNRMVEWDESDDDFEDEEDYEKNHTKEDFDSSGDGVDEDVIVDNDIDEKPHQRSEAGELFESVKDTVTSLFRISIIIRKASPRDRFAKALAAQQELFDDRFDILHVSHKFPILNTKEKEWFKKRVGKAITQRRQYLRYARDHREKLAKEPQDLWQPEDLGPKTDFLPVLSQAGKTNLTKSVSTLAPTAASTLYLDNIAIRENDFKDNQSQTSYAISLGEDDEDSHLQLPSLTDVSKGATTFECPLCWTIQDIQKESTWHKHIFGDLKPYICTFEDCDMKFFSDRRVWFEHELLHHRAQWCCDFCGKDDFRSLRIFQDHVRSHHMQSMTKDQLNAISEASRRSVDHVPASDCPFCHEWEAELRLANPNISADEIVVVTTIQFRRHVGAHMQQLALFSIPRGFLGDDADTNSVTSLSGSWSNVADIRKAEMTLEFGSPEDALERLQKLHGQAPDDAEVHLLLSKCYHKIGDEGAALTHIEKAQNLRVLAEIGDRSGRHSESDTKTSMELEVEMMKASLSVLEEDHPDTLTSTINHASAYINQGRWEDAEEPLVQLVEAHETRLGPEHPDTLISVRSLGRVLASQGKYKEAEVMYRRALEGREKMLEPKHPDTFTSISDLGSVLESQGRYEEAKAMHRRALEGREKVLGPEHPDTLTSISDLGSMLESQGRYEEAKAMHRRVLEGREKVLGPEHPDTLTSVSDLWSVLERQGKYEEAEAMYRRALEGYEKVLGPKHPDTFTSISDLGSVLESQGRHEKAKAMHRRVLEGREKVLGPEHPDTLISVRSLGSVLATIDDDDDESVPEKENIEATYEQVMQSRREDAKKLENQVLETTKTLSSIAKNDQFTIGWISPLPLEKEAARLVFDEEYPLDEVRYKNTFYLGGRIGEHKVVIGVQRKTGLSQATLLAERMLMRFPNIKYFFLVGIAGGVPQYGPAGASSQIVLGDVVVSSPRGNHGGVIQYDRGAWQGQGRLHYRGHTNGVPGDLMAAINNFRSEGWSNTNISKTLKQMRLKLDEQRQHQYDDPGPIRDRLFDDDYDHKGDDNDDCKYVCDADFITLRPDRGETARRQTDEPRVHFGNIASSNQLQISATERDRILLEHEAICFETEAAGVMEENPCVVVRGICDYADSHNNKGWQNYAAATAAACAKGLLSKIPAISVTESEESAKSSSHEPTTHFISSTVGNNNQGDVTFGNNHRGDVTHGNVYRGDYAHGNIHKGDVVHGNSHKETVTLGNNNRGFQAGRIDGPVH